MMNRPLLIALLACSLMTRASAEDLHVFILAGQSNMDGRGRAQDLVNDLSRFAAPQPDVKIAYANSRLRGPYATSGFVPLSPGFSVPPGTREKFGQNYKLPGSTFGPEVSFGR